MKPLLGVEIEPGWRKEFSWKSLAVRFLFGGIITAATGLIAQQFGPVVGGLFLAFPAILPASVTLIGRHDGKRAAGAGALGAIVGSIGLLSFGAVVWFMAPHYPGWLVLTTAFLAWLVIAVGLWVLFETLRSNTLDERRSETLAVEHRSESERCSSSRALSTADRGR